MRVYGGGKTLTKWDVVEYLRGRDWIDAESIIADLYGLVSVEHAMFISKAYRPDLGEAEDKIVTGRRRVISNKIHLLARNGELERRRVGGHYEFRLKEECRAGASC